CAYRLSSSPASSCAARLARAFIVSQRVPPSLLSGGCSAPPPPHRQLFPRPAGGTHTPSSPRYSRDKDARVAAATPRGSNPADPPAAASRAPRGGRGPLFGDGARAPPGTPQPAGAAGPARGARAKQRGGGEARELKARRDKPLAQRPRREAPGGLGGHLPRR